MDTSFTEEALVNRAISGDPAALATVIRLWGPRIRRFAGRLCPSTEILDAVQETLLVLADRIGSLRSAEALTSWSFQVVKRYCIKIFSTIRRESAVARDLGVLSPEVVHIDPARALLLEQLIGALEALPAKDREVLTLRDLQGLSLQEIREKLGLSLTAVKSRLHRARATLRLGMRV